MTKLMQQMWLLSLLTLSSFFSIKKWKLQKQLYFCVFSENCIFLHFSSGNDKNMLDKSLCVQGSDDNGSVRSVNFIKNLGAERDPRGGGALNYRYSRDDFRHWLRILNDFKGQSHDNSRFFQQPTAS